MSELHNDDDDMCHLLRNAGMLGYKNGEIKILAILKSYRKAFVTSMLIVIYSVSYFPCSGASSIPRSSTSKISVAYGGIGPPGFGRAPYARSWGI